MWKEFDLPVVNNPAVGPVTEVSPAAAAAVEAIAPVTDTHVNGESGGLPEISMFWPSTTEPSGPGGRRFGALTKSKKLHLQNAPRVTVCSYDFREFHLNPR